VAGSMARGGPAARAGSAGPEAWGAREIEVGHRPGA